MRRSSVLQVVCLSVSLALLCAGCARRDGKVVLAEQYAYAGNSYLADGKLDKALAEFEKARAVAPHHLPIYLRLGAIYTAKGSFAKAIQNFQYVLKQDPESAEAYSLWGSALVRQGRFAQALPKFERSAELDSSLPEMYRQWGLALVKLKRNAEAVSVFEQAAEIGPNPPAASLAHWGTALQHLGRREEAIRKYEAALERVPDHFTATNNLGLLLVSRASERARGIRLLEHAVKARPGNPSTLHNLGWAYIQVERFEEAYNLLQRSVAATDSSNPLYEERLSRLKLAEAQLPRREATPDMPNVVLFVLDTLRVDHLGSYGYARNTSPHIDALAQRGVVLENAIAQAPWTAASVASLFTGLYPSVHGLDGGIRWGRGQRSAGGTLPFAVQKVLSSSQLTLAEVFRRNGYRTAGFVSNVYVNSIFGFSQGFEVYNDEHKEYSKNVSGAKRRAEDTNRYVFEWLDQKPQEPFFLLVHYNDCHWPYNPPAPFGQDYVADYKGGLTPERTTSVVETQGRPITGLSDEDLAYLIGLYDGEIAYMDDQVGQLLRRIGSQGLQRDVITVITSDHGEEFLDHGSASHGYTLYEEMIHVPLIFHAPGRLAPARSAAQVRLIDVAPTLFSLAGIDHDVPQGMQGVSFVPVLEGKTATGVEEAFSEATYVGEKKALRTQQGLKLIYSFAQDKTMLFDLKADPGEKKSLSNGNSSLGDPLKEHLDLWVQANQATRVALYGADAPDQEVVLDEETKAKLEALGYIQ